MCYISEVCLAELKTLLDKEVTESEEKILKLLGGRIASLQNKQPLNNFGLPISYIDPQVIAESGLTQLSEGDIEQATIKLDYLEGYPMVEGLPFWERLEGEILYFYRLFKVYRDMREEDGSRSIAKVSEASNQKVPVIHALSNVYHWQDRVRAYDFYREKQIEEIKQNNLIKMENKHFKLAEEMFDGVKDIFQTLITQLKNNVTTKQEFQSELRKWLSFIVKLERLSLGLPADKPMGAKDVNAVIANYTLNQNQFQDNRQINVERPNEKRLDKMQEVVNVLAESGVLEEILKSGNNNGEEGADKIIDVTEEASA